jgi:hypothetical protein
MVYLSDVSPLSKPGALTESVWNTRGWTVQEFLAPNVVLFYQRNWTPYLDDHYTDHKESATIIQELGDRTGIDLLVLVVFRPNMRDAREKLKWISTCEEAECAQAAAAGNCHRSSLATLLHWIGSEYHPSSIAVFQPTSSRTKLWRPSTLPSLSEDDTQSSISSLRNAVTVELASKLYTLLDDSSAPRFANRSSHLPCIAFRITEIKPTRRGDHHTRVVYEVKAGGLLDLQITTKDKLFRFSRARPIPRKFLLVRPWTRSDLGLPDFEGVIRRAWMIGPILGLHQAIRPASLLEKANLLILNLNL